MFITAVFVYLLTHVSQILTCVLATPPYYIGIGVVGFFKKKFFLSLTAAVFITVVIDYLLTHVSQILT